MVLHHTALSPDISLERLATAFVNEGKPGIVYHYCISNKGVVYQIQPLNVVPFSNETFNRDSINVCLMGNFSEAPPPTAQLNATAILIAYLLDEFGLGVDQIYAHSDLAATESPGRTWPTWREPLLAAINNLVRTGTILTVTTPTPMPPPPPIPTPEDAEGP
jgi:N-acetyl-anhydromuramyl-L-alanine amidase AmpD